MNIKKAALTGAALLLPVVATADWTMWGGSVDRNMAKPDAKGAPTKWDVDSGENIKWSAELGSQTYGNPVIAGGKVFVGTNNGAARNPEITGDKGILMAFDEETGEFLWQAVHDKLPAGRVNDWPEQGICSSPHVEGERLWYVSNECQIVCADTEGFRDGENDGDYQIEKYTGELNGDFIWVLDMKEELGVFPHNLATSSPLIVGDTLFLVTGNGVDEGHLDIPSPRAPSFIGVDKNTGEVLWENKAPGKGILHGQWSSAAYGEVDGKGQVYLPGGDGIMYALDPETGKLIWEFDCNPKESTWELGGRGTRNNLIATPVFYDNAVYIGVGQDPEHGEGIGHFYAIDATKTGDVTESGKLWHFGELGRTMSTAAVTDEIVYICDLSGFLYALDRKTGKLIWEYDTLAAVWSSPTVIGDHIYLGDEDGDVAVLKEGGEKPELVGEYMMNNAVYTTPVFANGKLFISNRSELFVIEEK